MTQENQATTYGNAAQAGYATIPQGGLPQYTEAWALIEAARRMAEATAAETPRWKCGKPCALTGVCGPSSRSN